MFIKAENYRRNWVSIQHPFGCALTQSDRKFGYIRISKNASSLIASIKRLELNEWVELNKFNSDVYSIIRDPVQRFFSSIPETLSRYRPVNPVYPSNMGKRDVYVSNDIHEQLQNIQIHDLKSFLIQYLEMIEYGGFFDAHHEPQVSFLTTIDGHYYKGLNLFTLGNIFQGLNEIAKKYDIKKFDNIQDIKQVNSGNDTSNSFIKYFKQGFKVLNKQNELRVFDPIQKWGDLNKIPVKCMRQEFYKSIKKYEHDKDIVHRINKLYKQDFELSKSILSENKIIVRMS
jgi:hypothetical protein